MSALINCNMGKLTLALVILIVSATVAKELPCNNKSNCVYRISRPEENQYLIVKNILGNLYDRHWEITSRYLNFYFHAVLAKCDNNFDFTAIKRVIQKDYKHPNSLFGKLQSSQVNKTVKLQYEIEWLERYKMIKYNLQPIKYVDQCNSIGLKLYHLLHEFQTNEKNIFKCSHGYEDTVSDLVDFYIAQTFLKNCEGNLEMLAHGIYKLLKYDCSRAYRYKIAYFNSQYLNLFRACDPDRTVNDLLNSGNFNESCKAPASAKKIDCAWYEIVCKYPETCLKSMKWLVD